ncbi:MAG: LysR family transcriptional regulator [Ramlibacter sp.]|jgi:DNA-binding transcriptional LysR family regulator|nr:LysR family transcriptional regulator [Ramlibacter sp.]MDB5911659.1 LysR family transcriptional regulator [Ramlibacter sp.]
MDADLFALRAFVCLASELNFSRAATALHVSSSRLTRVIQTLERQVGVRLLARSTHGTALTPDGAEFLRSARRIVAEADWVGRRFTRHRVAGSATFMVGCQAGTLYDALPERVRAARVAHPKQQIRVVEMDESAITEQVLDGRLDLGFLYFPTADDEMESRVVSRRSQWVAMAPDHPLATRESLAVRDLAGHTLILPDEVLAPRLHRWYRSFLDKSGRRTFNFISTNQIHVALGLCAAGEGLCVVAEHLRRMRADDLHYVPLPDVPSTELSAIWRPDSPVRQIAQFIASW